MSRSQVAGVMTSTYLFGPMTGRSGSWLFLTSGPVAHPQRYLHFLVVTQPGVHISRKDDLTASGMNPFLPSCLPALLPCLLCLLCYLSFSFCPLNMQFGIAVISAGSWDAAQVQITIPWLKAKYPSTLKEHADVPTNLLNKGKILGKVLTLIKYLP